MNTNNDYCRILSILGMEKDGDPVAEVQRLFDLAQAPQEDQVAKLIEILTACYAGLGAAFNLPERFLDVLVDPLNATREQIDALLPVETSEAPQGVAVDADSQLREFLDRETILGIIAWLRGAAQGDRKNISRGEAAEALQRLLAAAPVPAPDALDDRKIADTVNQLRDIAIQFHGAQQLRERIAHVVVPLLKVAPDSEPIPDRIHSQWLLKIAQGAGFVVNPIGEIVVPSPNYDAAPYLRNLLKLVRAIGTVPALDARDDKIAKLTVALCEVTEKLEQSNEKYVAVKLQLPSPDARDGWREFRTSELPYSDCTAYLVMLKPGNDGGYVSDHALMAWYGLFKNHPNDWTIEDSNCDNGFCVVTADVTHWMPLPENPADEKGGDA